MTLDKSVIAAIRSSEDLDAACSSAAHAIFDLAPSINDVCKRIELCRAAGKPLFVHMDLIEGVGKDKAGLAYLKDCGIDGIISTRISVIKQAKDIDLKTVQRLFIIDSQAIKSATSILKTNPDMIEIMPGVVTRAISEFKKALDVPVIAGGLIENEADINAAFDSGASAVSTSQRELWDLKY